MINEKMKEDILTLKEAATYTDAKLAEKIAKEFNLGHITKDFEIFCLIGNIYKYGKIQGIREERAKRKNKLRKEVI